MGRSIDYYCGKKDIFSYKERYYKRNTKCDYCDSEFKSNEVVNGRCPNCNAPIRFYYNNEAEIAIRMWNRGIL